jgi:hypothetical protein
MFPTDIFEAILISFSATVDYRNNNKKNDMNTPVFGLVSLFRIPVRYTAASLAVLQAGSHVENTTPLVEICEKRS